MDRDLNEEQAEPEEPKTMAETFGEAFPHYLAMGMTYEQFWEQDCSLVIPYREAHKLRQEQDNRNAWLQGLYISKALQSSPLLVSGFIPKGVRIEPYFDKPIDFNPKKKTKKEINQAKMGQAAAFMNALMIRFNSKNQEKRELEAKEDNKSRKSDAMKGEHNNV